MIDFWRQKDFFNPEEHKDKRITVVGSGSVGSFVVLALSKLGVKNITVYDNDKIENHNIPNQFYKLNQIGKLKTEALQEIITEFTGSEIKTKNQYVEEKTEIEFGDVVIVTTDSMSSRKLVWEKCKNNPNITKFMDVRMGGEVMKIYTIKPFDPDDITMYEKTLHSDEKAAELPCTARTIIYNILVIAGFVASQVKKVLLTEENPREIIFDLKTLHLIIN